MWWGKLWRHYKPTAAPYAWGGPEWSASKRLLVLGLSSDDLEARARRYFQNPSWSKFGNHSFPVFVKNINNVAPEETAPRRAVARLYVCGCGFRGDSVAMIEHAETCQMLAHMEEQAAHVSETPAQVRALIEQSLRG